MFLWFQIPRRVKLEELIGLRNYYNKLEVRWLIAHIFVILMYCFFQYLIDWNLHQYSLQQDNVPKYSVWETWTDEQKANLQNSCHHYANRAKFVYIVNYGSLVVLISIVVIAYNYLTKRHANENFIYHRNQSYKYTCFLFISLGIKMYLVTNLLSYDTNTLPIYAVSELVVMMLFSVFKKDEDCFTCFQRCTDLETYSIF
jgi:hypothetical protein